MSPASDPDLAVADDRGVRGLLVRVLNRLDRWVERHEGYHPIGGGGYILRLRIGPHRRPRVVLADGTVINPGDLVGELHLDNQLAAALHRQGHGGLRFRRELRRMLPALALDVCTRPEYREVRAVGAATLFGRQMLTSTLGFECRPLPPFTRWWLGTWELILLAAYHPEGRRRLARGRGEELQQVWISRRALERVMAPDGRGEDAGASAARA